MIKELNNHIPTTIISEIRDVKSEITALKGEVKSINSKCDQFEAAVKEMRSDINNVKDNNDVMYHGIDALAEKMDSMCERVNQFDLEMDKLESFSRRDNVILYGIPEAEGEKSMACKETAISVLNEHVTFKTWQPSDVTRAHRLGVKRTNVDRPRPVIVKLAVSGDMVRALKARATLRENGYGVSSDLTIRQRQQLSALKGSGQFGFLKNGKLVTKSRLNEGTFTASNPRQDMTGSSRCDIRAGPKTRSTPHGPRK